MGQTATTTIPASYKVYVQPDVLNHYNNKIIIQDLKVNNFEVSRWADAIIPYVIDDNVDKKLVTLLNDAIDEFHSKTSVVWVYKQSKHVNYISIQQGEGCFAQIGCCHEGKQLLMLCMDGATKDHILSHMMECLGFIGQNDEFFERARKDFEKNNWYMTVPHCANRSVLHKNAGTFTTLTKGDVYAVNVLYNDLSDDCKIDECIISNAFVLIICISTYDYDDDLPGTNIDKQNMINLWK
eukprot:96848_1